MAKTYTVEELSKTLDGLKVGDEGKLSLMAEYLTKNKDKLDELMKRKTKLGGTLVDCVKSGNDENFAIRRCRPRESRY